MVTVIGACKNSDNSSDSSTATAGDVTGSGTTASGTIEGNSDLTGIILTYYNVQEPSGGVWTIVVQFQNILILLQIQKVLKNVDYHRNLIVYRE